MQGKYDVIVIGAGPAGSTAAKIVAQRGLEVLLIEKRQEIGEPIRCAGGIMRGDLIKFLEPEGRWVLRGITGFRIYSPEGNFIEFKTRNPENPFAYSLDRKAFDQELARRAAVAGAEIMVKTQAVGLVKSNHKIRGVKIRQWDEEREIEAKVIIAADGIEGQVGRWAGLDTRLNLQDILVDAQYLIVDPHMPEECEIFLGWEIAPGGYAWIFPREEKTAYVGLGIRGDKGGALHAIDYLDKFISQRLPGAKKLELVAGAVPISGTLPKIVVDNLMLVGDAAHQSDPLTGGGIATAMEAGTLAGEVAAKAIKSGEVSEKSLSEYQRNWERHFGKILARNLRIRETLVELKNDDMNKLIGAFKGIEFDKPISALEFIKILVRTNPKLLWKLRHLL